MSVGSTTTFSELERYGRLYSGGKVASTPDGTLLACTCGEELSLVDVATGKLVLSVSTEGDELTAFALHPHRPEIVTAGRSRLVRHWAYDVDGRTCQQLRSWKAHKLPAVDLAYDQTGTLAASAGADGAVMVFDVPKGFCTHVFRGHSGVVVRVLFQPNEMRIASCGNDHSIRIWDLHSRGCLHTLDGHVAVSRALAFSPEGELLLTGGADQILNVWEVESGKLKSSLTLLEPIEFIAIDPAPPAGPKNSAKPKMGAGSQNGTGSQSGAGSQSSLSFVTAGGSGLLRRWLVGSNACVQAQPAPPAGIVLPGLTHLLHCRPRAASPPSGIVGSGQLLLVGVTEDHNLLLYDAASLELTRTIVGYNDEITDLKFIAAPPAGMAAPPAGISPGPSQLAVATNSDQIRLFDLARMGCRLLLGHTDVVLCLAASKSGSLLASASKDATVRLWDASSGRPVGRCVGHTDAIGAVAFGGKESAAAGKEAAGGPPLGIPAVLLSASKDRTMKRWDLSPLLGRGKQKAGGRDTAGGGPMELRCASTVLAHGKEVNALAVSPNDKLAISGSQDRSLKVWALGSGGETGGASADALSIGAEPLGVLKGHKRAVWACAFSPVDRVAASGSGDMTVKVWSISDYSCLRTFEGHVSSVLKVIFVRGGTLVASSGSDGLVKLWGVKSSECAATLDAHSDKVWALDAFEPPAGIPTDTDGGGRLGGLQLVSGSADSVIVRWADTSAATAGQATAASLRAAEDEQRLANAIASGAASAAFAAALSLLRPRALLSVLRSIPSTPSGDASLQAAVAEAPDPDALAFCLECVRDWSTRAQHALAAHRLLHAILKVVPASSLATLPRAKEVVEGILPYAERHFERIDKLLVGTRFVDYTLASMRMLTPDVHSAAAHSAAAERARETSAGVAAAAGLAVVGKGAAGAGGVGGAGGGAMAAAVTDALAALGAALMEEEGRGKEGEGGTGEEGEGEADEGGGEESSGEEGSGEEGSDEDGEAGREGAAGVEGWDDLELAEHGAEEGEAGPGEEEEAESASGRGSAEESESTSGEGGESEDGSDSGSEEISEAPAEPTGKTPAKFPAKPPAPAKSVAKSPAKSPAKPAVPAKTSAQLPARAKRPVSRQVEPMATPTAPPAEPSPRRTRAKAAALETEAPTSRPPTGARAGTPGRESAVLGRKRRGVAGSGSETGTSPAAGVAATPAGGSSKVTPLGSDARKSNGAQGGKRHKAQSPAVALGPAPRTRAAKARRVAAD